MESPKVKSDPRASSSKDDNPRKPIGSEGYDLEKDILNHANPDAIAHYLILHVSKSKNTDPYSAAMAVLNFYVNRADFLPDSQKAILDQVKKKLKDHFQQH